jgi:hypothetical protein
MKVDETGHDELSRAIDDPRRLIRLRYRVAFSDVLYPVFFDDDCTVLNDSPSPRPR